MAVSVNERHQARNDLAWAISVGGIGVILFAALLLFAWNFAATLFLIFAGILLGVALNAMTGMLGHVVKLPHTLRLTIVCLVLAGFLSGVVFLGGATIAQQATVLSDTIKSQLISVKAFLERNGIDTGYFDLGNQAATSQASSTSATPGAAPTYNLPSAGAIASSGGAIVSQTFKLLLGTVSAVGNFFIVLFLGLTFAAQPSVYRSGLLFIFPARHRARATVIVDRIGETLERWLIAQIVTMFAVFLVTWIGLSIIGIQSSFILGIQAGLLAFIPDGRRADRRVDRGAREPCFGMGRRGQRIRAFPGRSCAGKLHSHANHTASGARHSSGHFVLVPDPAGRGVRDLGFGACPALDSGRKSHDRSFQV